MVGLGGSDRSGKRGATFRAATDGQDHSDPAGRRAPETRVTEVSRADVSRTAGDELTIELVDLFHLANIVVARHDHLASVLPKSVTQWRIREQADDAFGQRTRVAWLHEEAGLAVADPFPVLSVIGRYNW